MAKSMRSKREKRLRAIRRDIVQKETFHQKKEDAKLAALEAALAAPKLPVRQPPTSPFMEVTPSTSNPADESSSAAGPGANDMDVESADEKQNKSLKPIGKKLKKKFKLGKKNRRGKGLLRGKKHI
ncbi:PREDICTED: uncharacterized protein LOC104812696 [Tarenaya hassleriana]|uniref:uncharacterized protein LOC104812696 n=1 Tax=Tarenaya hassleriana TaxID=28532 RepID=UPI00053C5098|nr:PREDICTED: uncharacterized protein LOC104812696 [Tarenaya hassleriana]